MTAAPEQQERWDRELVAAIVSIGAKHEIAFDDDRIPMFTWKDTSPQHELHLMGYLDPTDGLWWHTVELIDDPNGAGRRLSESHRFDDRGAAFDMVADLLNRVATTP